MTGARDQRDRSIPTERKDLLAETGLVRAARHIQPGQPSDDARELPARRATGGGVLPGTVASRQGRAFHLRRQLHRVVLVAGVREETGLLTWETQAVDYPSVGPDSPEYEPRGSP